MDPNQSSSQSPVIPIAIIIGFALIALAIFFGGGRDAAPAVATAPTPVAATPSNPDGVDTTAIRPVDETDYFRGNPNAPIVIIEYSDYECPFCKQYHTVLRQIMDEYGVTGRVAWVYRQFPIPQIHPNAKLISEAALCVGDIGGNEAFWRFSDRVFDSRGTTELVNVTRLPAMAEESGVSRADYNECVTSGRMMPAVEASMTDGFNAGIRGTPYTIIQVAGESAVVNGSQSYDFMKSIIDDLIERLIGAGAATPPSSPDTVQPPAALESE